MTWLLIAVVLLVAFGPVLWLVPSKKDKRLAAMRERGRKEGLVIEMRRIPKVSPDPTDRVTPGGKVLKPELACASYGLMLPRRLRHLPAWRAVRAAAAGDDGPFPGWDYDQRPKGPGRAHLGAMLDKLKPVFDDLIEDVAALEISASAVLAYCLERPGTGVETVSELAAVLRRLEAELTGLERAIEAELANDDS